jgi:hypothetical protein
MTSGAIGLISGYFAKELIDERPEIRTSLHNGTAEGVQRVRAEFGNFLQERPMTRDELYRATSARFHDDEEMYRELGEAYRFFFDEEPPVPAS